MVVLLHCVKEGTKVRVRISAFIDQQGKTHTGVYNNDLNCQFSRALRVEGRCFRVPDENVKLCGGSGKRLFYSISAKNIEIVSDIQSIAHVYKVCEECVVCMEKPVEVILSPCGHSSTCSHCAARLVQCCICRGAIAAILRLCDE